LIPRESDESRKEDARNRASGACIKTDAIGAESERSGIKFPYAALRYVAAGADALLIVAAGYLGNLSYQAFVGAQDGSAETLLRASVLAAALYLFFGHLRGIYEFRSVFSARADARRIFVQWSLVSLVLGLLAFLMKVGPVFSRGAVVCFAVYALVLLICGRMVAKKFAMAALNEGQVQGRRVIILGAREELAALDLDESLKRFGFSEVKRVSLATNRNQNFALTESELQSVNDAMSSARDTGANAIVLALPWGDTRKLELIRDRLRASPLPVQLLPDRRIRSLADNPSFQLRKSLSIDIQRGPLSRQEQLYKRSIDVVGASLALIALTPLMLLTALTIKLDSAGPALFRQRRNGFNSKQFVIFKFRTMSVMEDGASVSQATKSDLRVTKVGRLLRRSSVDELPQLFNVLLGDMSLVGPRPHALAHDDHYGDLLSDYAFRHHVKPGITGWAQVRGFRGETARIEQMKGRIDCDLWYINNWSLVLDLRIIALTIFEVLRRRNAY
jgi:Undecaprenyl-phosphate glucose phosphotransferase